MAKGDNSSSVGSQPYHNGGLLQFSNGSPQTFNPGMGMNSGGGLNFGGNPALGNASGYGVGMASMGNPMGGFNPMMLQSLFAQLNQQPQAMPINRAPNAGAMQFNPNPMQSLQPQQNVNQVAPQYNSPDSGYGSFSNNESRLKYGGY